jgi:hypothetical protein
MIVRRIFTVEASLPLDKPAEALEWLQRFFDYFHPALSAVVKIGEQPVAPGALIMVSNPTSSRDPFRPSDESLLD